MHRPPKIDPRISPWRDPLTGVVPTVPEDKKPNPLNPPPLDNFGRPMMVYDPVAEQRLWNAVILQAVQDATFEHAVTPEFTVTQRESLEAIEWLLGNSQEFQAICRLALARPERIALKVREKLASRVPELETRAAWWRNRSVGVIGRSRSHRLEVAYAYEDAAELIQRPRASTGVPANQAATGT